MSKNITGLKLNVFPKFKQRTDVFSKKYRFYIAGMGWRNAVFVGKPPLLHINDPDEWALLTLMDGLKSD